MRLLVLANLLKPETHAALPRVAEVASRLGIELVQPDQREKHGEPEKRDERTKSLDAALVLGGDGSMLHAVRQLAGADLPVVGINTGTLGYMACAGVSRIDETLLALRDGALVEEPRRMIQGEIVHGPKSEVRSRTPDSGLRTSDPGLQTPDSHPIGPALNEIVVTRGDTGRILSLDLSIDGTPVTSYLCDGLIVATPTGSTAYSLSAGGPILSPGTHAVVVSVICPHSLSSRPLVLPDSAVLDIRVRRAAVDPLVASDGQDEAPLPPDATLRISRSPRVVRLLRFPDRDEFSVLRQKLGWSGSSL